MKLLDFIFSKSDLEKIIKRSHIFYAHLSQNHHKPELLIDHLLLVQSYFEKLVQVHGLNDVIISLIAKITKNEKIRRLIADIFVKSIVIHDFGKVNPEFQKIKMKNPIDDLSHNLSSVHSLISGFIFTLYSEFLASKYDLNDEDQSFADFLVLFFSYPILKHHSSKLDDVTNNISYEEDILKDLNKFTVNFNDLGDINLINEINEYVCKNHKAIFNKGILKIKNEFSLFALLKLNYSLLTASDYYATTHFMKNWNKLEIDFGVLNDNLRKKIISNMEKSTSYNKKTYQNLANYTIEFPAKKNNENLNKLRQNLAVEVIKSIRQNQDKNLFYIEAPTGAGKTNLSMLALTELLRDDWKKKKNNITKVFYVFPFTTLITQTFAVLQKTLGVNTNEIVQIHSKAGFSSKSRDDDYGNEKQNLIDYQFANYPIVLLSHIKFFDILKTNKKSINYLLHRLANSVVIIDELQTYPPKEWDKIIYFINSYARFFNIKFILMSATLPKIDKLLSNEAQNTGFEKEEFIYLVKNRDKYFMNPNFSDRVEFDFSLLNNNKLDKENRKEFLYRLYEKLKDESISYQQESTLNRVHTIIEFIYKNTANDFFDMVNEKNEFFEEVFLLSGTILEPRRKEIISKLKSKNYAKKKILLISTQVVEAGVDIDMDMGFKDFSLIDSDEQLAGRINRNISKPKGKLFIFNFDDEKIIYGNDYRYKVLQEQSKDTYPDILANKNFDKIYDLVMRKKSIHNNQYDYADNLPGYISFIKNLNFPSIDSEFKLITNSISNITIFVPVKVPVSISDSDDSNFTNEELNFLEKKGKHVKDSKTVSGDDVWELYENVITSKDEDFTNKKIQIVILQGLMSKFTFSVGTYSKQFQHLASFNCGKEKFGYYKLNCAEGLYDYETGIKTKDGINFL